MNLGAAAADQARNRFERISDDLYDDVAPELRVEPRRRPGDAGAVARARRAGRDRQELCRGHYSQYVGSTTHGVTGIVLANASSVRRYFTPGLASLILDDEAAAHQRGEPPTLDGDAFVGHQDWDIADLSIDVKEIGSKGTATVSFNNFGKAEKIVVELLKVGESWRIADITWDTGTLRGLFRKK